VERTSAVCWADYDNDGLLDLFLANADVNSLYHNDGDGTFSSVSDSAVVTEVIPDAALFLNCAWADHDNDGFIDLVVSWGNPFVTPSTSNLLLYHNEGDGRFAKVTEGEIVTRRGGFPSWGDYDNDGFVDLLLPSGAFGVNLTQLYRNDGNANAWLDVKLVGTVSNRSGIGAKVRVHASYRGADRWQLREISGGDSQENQQSLNAEFGLADAAAIDTLRIEWPSGIVQEAHDLESRQFLTITEPLGDGRLLVCHKGKKTKVIKETALGTHLGHADVEGFCPDEGAALVCHKGKKTKLARARSLAAHVRHGDRMGACLN
jgi:hypothetical protein